MKKKAIFLDRDGTINVEKYYLYKNEDFEFIPGAIEALKLLQVAGYLLIIITNQSGIGRGFFSEKDFEKLNFWMMDELFKRGIKIDKVYYCPHLPDARIDKYKKDCECRKPKLGMFRQAIEEFDIDLSESFAIGDKIRDCAICFSSECRGYLIERNELSLIIDEVINNKIEGVCYASSLYDAALDILGKHHKRITETQ